MSDTVQSPLHDSGERRTTESGAVRDRAKGKGRFDLLPADAIFDVAAHFEHGAAKYEDRNWEKGMPLSWFLDSALRHAFKTLRGDTDEPHAVAAAWNLLCFIQTRTWIEQGLLPADLDDLPKRTTPADDAVKAYTAKARQVYGDYLDKDFADEDDLTDKAESVIDDVPGLPVPPPCMFYFPSTPSNIHIFDGYRIIPSFGGLQPEPVTTAEFLSCLSTGRVVLLTHRFISSSLSEAYRCVEFLGDQGFFVRNDGRREAHPHPVESYLYDNLWKRLV